MSLNNRRDPEGKIVASTGLDASNVTGDQRLEIYKTYLTTALAVSSNRQWANSFYATVNGAIIAFSADMLGGGGAPAGWPLTLRLALTSAAGIVLSYTWYRLIRSYRDLNTAKFKVIHAIEDELPLAPHQIEWEAVGHGKDPKRYLPFTHIELRLPLIFIALHLAALLLSVPWPELWALVRRL
jgi:hypothetical protein